MRKREEFKRNIGFRKVHKIVVIAFEGASDKAEDRYFAGIQKLINGLSLPASPRFYIHSIPNSNNLSAPNYIFENINSFNKDELDLDFNEDRSFLLIDYDQHLTNIENHKIVDKCQEGSINLIICRPCFELWLLLHFEDISLLEDEEQQRLLQNTKVKGKGFPINNRLFDACGSANKSNLDFVKYENNVEKAVKNCIKLNGSDDTIPDTLSARVDKILKEVGVNYDTVK